MVGREGFEPSTNGLKDRNSVIKRLTIQPLTGTPVATYAQLCTTDSRKTPALCWIDIKNNGVLFQFE